LQSLNRVCLAMPCDAPFPCICAIHSCRKALSRYPVMWTVGGDDWIHQNQDFRASSTAALQLQDVFEISRVFNFCTSDHRGENGPIHQCDCTQSFPAKQQQLQICAYPLPRQLAKMFQAPRKHLLHPRRAAWSAAWRIADTI
jgi:hypothetical protein